MKQEDMRSLTIDTSLKNLKKIDGWNCEIRKHEMGSYNVLKSNDKKIEIVIEVSGNQLQTVNILTQDASDKVLKLKDDQIMELAKSLDKAGIGYSINVSDNDIKELLGK